MTKQPSGSSLAQTRDSEPDQHSLFHRNDHDTVHNHHHRHRHIYRRQRYTDAENIDDEEQQPLVSTLPNGHESDPHSYASLGRASADALKGPESFHFDESFDVDPVDQVDSSSNPHVNRRGVLDLPSSVVVGPVLGNTVAIPVPTLPATAAVSAPASKPTTRATRPTRSSKYVIATRPAAAAVHTTSTGAVSSASKEPATKEPTSTLPASSPKPASSSIISSAYPHLGDLHNGTIISVASSNTSFTASSSIPKSLPLATRPAMLSSNSSGFAFSALSVSSPSLTASLDDDDSFVATAFSAAATPSQESDIASATELDTTSSISDSAMDSTATRTDAGNVVQTPAVFDPQPSVTPSSQPNEEGGGILSHPQNRRIIGSVAGSIAGLAFVALLVLLVLRYKKRKGSDGLLGSTKDSGPFRSLRGEESTSIAEKSGLTTVAALFSNFSRKKRPAQLTGSGEEGTRGFHRVAGRKLPPAIFTGGDGYSDPRESIVSGVSDYNRGSQAFDLTAEGQCQLALGAPMRPVSGVPIMRSGPARTPVTENPFDDTPRTPTTPDMPMRPPGSRASASKFHESL